jgi:hypothetical protein
MVYRDMSLDPSFSALDDRDLLAHAARLASAERTATASLIACLAEVDARRLYLGEGFSSLFTYCTRALHLSEHAAYGRIEAARLVRRFPVVLQQLAAGDVTLTTVTLLGPILTEDNHRELFDAARYKSKREVEQMVAAHRPRPDVPSTIRKLPAPSSMTNDEPRTVNGAPAAAEPVSTGALAPHVDALGDAILGKPDATPRSCAGVSPLVSAPPRPAIVTPLAPARYRVQFTASRETHDKLRRAQDLLRHTIPNGDVAAIFDRALTLLVDHLERIKLARTTRPRTSKPVTPDSRAIPAAVRRAVSARDGGRCAFVGAEGRCSETSFLEFHHVEPFARGGAATVDNIQLRCRAHNWYEAVEEFGPLFVRERGAEYFTPAV